MKTTNATISASLRAEIDFEYIKEATEIQREIAVYYEYSRHSEEVMTTVDCCRTRGFFDRGPVPSFLTLKNDAFFRHMSRIAKVIPARVLAFLVDCPDFPNFPFGSAPRTERSSSQELLIRSPVDASIMPLKLFKQFPEVINAINPTFHMLTIDWTYSNAEIAEAIEKLRPPQFPNPKRAGRGGGTVGAGAIDKFNQLAAYRLNLNGYDFERGGKLTLNPITSATGWKNAVQSAQYRIENIMNRPLFDT